MIGVAFSACQRVATVALVVVVAAPCVAVVVPRAAVVREREHFLNAAPCQYRRAERQRSGTYVFLIVIAHRAIAALGLPQAAIRPAAQAAVRVRGDVLALSLPLVDLAQAFVLGPALRDASNTDHAP